MRQFPAPVDRVRSFALKKRGLSSHAPPAPHGSLIGKTVVVTGGSDGIGKATVRACVEAGATVVMVGRNEAKTAAAAQAIMSATGRRAITWEVGDLSRQEAVRDVASRLRVRCARIDMLVNNAGAVYADREVTSEGIERTFALNHLAYFSLTLLLLDRLKAAARPGAPSRVINVASRAHVRARFDLDDAQLKQGYGAWRAYANSKLCNLLFTRALARRLDPAVVIVEAVHPGLVSTRFASNNGWRGRLVRRLMDISSLSAEEGADTVTWLTAAAAPLESSGGYWVKRQLTSPSHTAQDVALGERLWTYSAQLACLNADEMIASTMAP